MDRWPVSYFVYSSMSYLGSRVGGALPGPWFVAALGEVGIAESAVRQTLYRLVNRGDFLEERRGRVKWYRPTPLAAAEIAAGLDKLIGPEPPPWDGTWSLLHVHFRADQRAVRDRVRAVLTAEGFGALGGGSYLHPRNRTTGVLDALAEMGLTDQVVVATAARIDRREFPKLVARLWDLGELGSKYQRFVERFDSLARADRPAPAECFRLRFAMVFEFLDIAWHDPNLAAGLLPKGWIGPRARRLARELYRKLLPGAIAHGRSLLRTVTAPELVTAKSGST